MKKSGRIYSNWKTGRNGAQAVVFARGRQSGIGLFSVPKKLGMDVKRWEWMVAGQPRQTERGPARGTASPTGHPTAPLPVALTLRQCHIRVDQCPSVV